MTQTLGLDPWGQKSRSGDQSWIRLCSYFLQQTKDKSIQTYPSLPLHLLSPVFDQCHGYRFVHWKANDGFRRGITRKFLAMFLDDRGAYVQADVWLLEAEPGKHSIVVKSWIGVSGHLEIIRAFNSTWCCGAYGRSDLPQILLRPFRTSCYVCVYFISNFAFYHNRIVPSFRGQAQP